MQMLENASPEQLCEEVDKALTTLRSVETGLVNRFIQAHFSRNHIHDISVVASRLAQLAPFIEVDDAYLRTIKHLFRHGYIHEALASLAESSRTASTGKEIRRAVALENVARHALAGTSPPDGLLAEIESLAAEAGDTARGIPVFILENCPSENDTDVRRHIEIRDALLSRYGISSVQQDGTETALHAKILSEFPEFPLSRSLMKDCYKSVVQDDLSGPLEDAGCTEHIVLLFLSSTYAEYWQPWFSLFKQHGHPLLVIAMDKHTDRLVSDDGVVCVKRSIYYNQPNFFRVLWQDRVKIVHLLLRHGVDVVLTGVDSFWVGSPINCFSTADEDVVAGPDWGMPRRIVTEQDTVMNMDLYRIRSNENTIASLPRVARLCRLLSNDQSAFNVFCTDLNHGTESRAKLSWRILPGIMDRNHNRIINSTNGIIVYQPWGNYAEKAVKVAEFLRRLGQEPVSHRTDGINNVEGL